MIVNKSFQPGIPAPLSPPKNMGIWEGENGEGCMPKPDQFSSTAPTAEPPAFPGFCGTVPPSRPAPDSVETLATVTQRTAGLVSDPSIREMVKEQTIELPASTSDSRDQAKSFPLSIQNVDWSDNHRYDNSAGGGNITDATIAVVDRESGTEKDPKVTLLPIIRGNNFSDQTVDIDISRIQLRVGNEKGESLETVSLTDYLGDIKKYLSDPESIGDANNLLVDSDTHVLSSALKCSQVLKAAFSPCQKAKAKRSLSCPPPTTISPLRMIRPA